jgi:hypothetical protein
VNSEFDNRLVVPLGVLVSTVGEGANEEVDGVRKEKERLTTDSQPRT